MHTQFSATLESQCEILRKSLQVEYVQTDMSLKKFWPGGTEEQLLKSMSFPCKVSLKEPYWNAKAQFEHVFYVPLAMQFTYEELRYSIFQNSFLLIPFGADLLYKNRYGETILWHMLWLIYCIPGHYLATLYGKLTKKRKSSIQPIPELKKLPC